MGIDCVLFERLVALAARGVRPGRSVMLGRQGFKLERAYARRYSMALKRGGYGMSRFDLLQEDGFSETMFRKLGFGDIETADFSDYEGATILQDLNEPLAEELKGQFDFIFDGGTIEHVFNVPQALDNVFDMLAPGGLFISANGLNGWTGHGMYQFNPELVWTYWQRARNCEVLTCLGLPKDPGEKAIVFPDPAARGVRLKLRRRIPEGRVYLYYEVRKTQNAERVASVLQSDYAVKWASHRSRQANTAQGAIQ
ncbi:MAG: hypothetical protein ACK4NE_05770 [Albidovulum sp.]